MPDYDHSDPDAAPTEADTRVQVARDRFRLGEQARTGQRDREKRALAFQVPEKQWPDEWRDQRKGQTIGNIVVAARPMLSIPSLDQPVQLILNQEKAAHLGVQIHPLSEDADDDTAEVLQGLYRRIEVDSRANLARSFAFERAVKCGVGEYEVCTEYDPESGDPSDQRIVIKRLLHQGSIVRDPFAQEPDFSDGLWAFKPMLLAWDAYKQKYSTSRMAKFEEADLIKGASEWPGWITGEGAGRAVLVAGYYEIRITTQKVTRKDSADTYDRETRELWYSVINAAEELEPPTIQDGKYIPLIPAIGRELIPFDDERRWTGIIEPNMDAVRLLNVSASNAVEIAALETRAPWLLAEGQEEGHELEWGLANVRNFPYIRYKPTTIGGEQVREPVRTQADVSKLGPSMMLLQQAREFIHSGTGAFPAALGDADARSKTKGGTLALQQQHDQGNSNYLDNLAEISLTYEAKVVLDLIPHIYDRPGRVARILDKEDNPRTVMLNAPFTLDPRTKRPTLVPRQGPAAAPMGGAPPAGFAAVSGPSAQMPQPGGGQPPSAPMPPPGMPGQSGPPGMPPRPPQGQPAPPKVLHYDLKKGRYGVTVSVGKSYKSRTEQGADELGQLFQAEPKLFEILGDIYLKFRDFPGHIEASERMKKMLPPPLQAGDDPQAAEQQLGAAKQHMAQMEQQLQQAAELLKTEKIKYDAQIAIEKIKQDAAIELQHVKNAAPISVAWINAQTKGVLSAHEAQDEALATGLQVVHEAAQAERDRQHQAEMAAMGQQHALELGQQGGMTSATLASQQHAQSLDAGDAAHAQTLESQQQAADLAPAPDEDSA